MEVIIILFLICLNGLLSMAEISVVSARKSKLETQSKKGNKKAGKVLKAIEQPDKFLSTIQIGITAIGLLTGIYSGDSIGDRLRTLLVECGISPALAGSISIVSILIIVTYFTIILGELVPKRIGLTNPERISTTMIGAMSILSKILHPFVWLLSISTAGVVKLFHIHPNKHAHITEEEIRSIIQEGRDTGEVQPEEQDIMERVFSLGDRDLRSLMTHRNDLIWIDVEDSWNDVERKISEKVHYIYPVSEDSIENIIGVVFLKDIFTCNHNNFRPKLLAHPPQFLPENTSVYHALNTFKKNKIHYAIITDEFGVMQGMVTMNDILESLVGNASELDTENEEYEITEQPDGSWIVDGQYPFFDFLAYFDLDNEDEDYPFYTVGGLFLEQTGHIPHVGESLKWKNFYFEILQMDHVRIAQLRVSKVADPA